MKTAAYLTVAGVCLVLAGSVAMADTITMLNSGWNASNTKDFGNAGYWSPSQVPGSGDTAVFQTGPGMTKPAKCVNINHSVYGVNVPTESESKWSFHGKGSVVTNSWVDDAADDYVFTIGDGDFNYNAGRWGKIQVQLAGTMDYNHAGRAYSLEENCTFTGLLHLIDGGWDSGATQTNISLAADGAWGRGGVLLDDDTKLVVSADQTHAVPITLMGATSWIDVKDDVDMTVTSLTINGLAQAQGTYTGGQLGSQVVMGTNASVTVLPEPATLLVLGLGGAALAIRRRRR